MAETRGSRPLQAVGRVLSALALTVSLFCQALPAAAAPASNPHSHAHASKGTHVVKAAHVRAPRSAMPKRSMLGAAKPQKLTFRSGGRTVRVDLFAPPAQIRSGARQPAVIMLHGAHGIGGGLMIYPQAEALAARGISAYVVSYYDGLPDKVRSKASPGLFAERDRIIGDALNYVAGRDDVDPNALGVFGLSLGGFHAIGLAARDARVQALVNVFGAVPASLSTSLEHLPPTLILHGDKDPIVPLAHSRALDRRLAALGVEHELVVYKGQGHCFRDAALEDSIARTTRFFAEHLIPRQVTEPSGEGGDDVMADHGEAPGFEALGGGFAGQ